MVSWNDCRRGRSRTGVFSCLLAFGLAWVLVLAGCAPAQSSSGASSASASDASNASASSADSSSSASSAASSVSAADVDIAATFPSWNPESSSLKTLVDFVASVTDEKSDAYVEPADRIATFDMDGTIICEKAPVYVDYMLLLHRVLDNAPYNNGYTPSEETKQICQGIRDTVMTGEKYSSEQSANKHRLIASEFAGMTCEEFRSYVKSFATSQNAAGFEGMTYAESFYKPMIEVINFLKSYDFDVWMVSACEREVVRGLVPLAVDIPMDRIIATDVGYYATNQGDKAGDEYNMGLGEDILLGTPLGEENGETNKSISIMREIGKRPILAFGNSSGDYAMLNFAQSNPDHKGMGVLVLCDDTTREYGDADRAATQTEEAQKNGWTLFHMSDQDWATIYGEGVTKTGFAAKEGEQLAAAA